ncbi:MAG: hypothetical protein KME12_15120 [Trichocoleus desertorum ATA4-8-CV12]|jgi:hypothetical protein|nr:hypothetical protein [Trichocoleus desertorum ATA4-8-CV12]
MNQNFEAIEIQDAVVSVPEEYCAVVPRSMFKIEEFSQKAKILISNQYRYGHAWIQGGAPCEILEPGKAWRKGKIRVKVSLEFCPDEVELPEPEKSQVSNQSPLDEIRQAIAEDN